MPKIEERQYADCSFGRAQDYLYRYIASLPKDDAGKPILHLSVQASDLKLPGDTKVGKDVIAQFSRVEDERHLEWISEVRWAPKGGGPYPTFDGSIRIQADENYGSCTLILKGTYEPPLGALGQIFDAALGRRIAKATARTLLRELADAVEQLWTGGPPKN